MKYYKYIMLSERTGYLIVLLLAFTTIGRGQSNTSWSVDSEFGKLSVEMVTYGIRVPFGMAFLPQGELLVTDRVSGNIIKVDPVTGNKILIEGVPESFCKGDGGALDIILHPDFAVNQLVYFSHSVGDKNSSTLVVDMARLQGNELIDIRRIFTAYPYYDRPSHYGSRMAFLDNFLFITMGDRYDLADKAQSLDNHLGKVIRLRDDGTIPEDNPFYNKADAKPEIWSYGHRNPQGLLVDPVSNNLWLNEHGPKGGDEINMIRPGLNYGWPVISYGTDYDDSIIGEGITHKEGMEQPFYQYTPSIAPSGFEIYTGNKFPNWKNNFFIGALAKRHLNRIRIESGQVIIEERLLTELELRIRVVRQGPDGYIYLGVDGGRILRVRPADNLE